MNVQYDIYEASLTNEQQTQGFLTSSTSNALTTSATLFSPAVTKSILAGTATFINATSANYNESVLFKQTMQLLQSQMRANRAHLVSQIIERLRQPDDIYPLELALSDTEELYQAGTLPGALIKANATVNAAEDVAQGEKEAALSYSLNREDAAVLVRNSLVVNGKYNTPQARRLEALLKKRGVTQRLEIVISSPQYSAETTQLARDAGLIK